MATLKREVKKLPSESNLRLLSSLIVSIANKQSSLEDKCIAPWKADETYQKDISYVSHNGYVYICSVTNQDSVFTESHWVKLSDNITELDVDTIKSYLNLTQEQITTLQSLIDDTTITTTKTNSSSKIYMDIQAAIAECKDDTLKQIAKKVSGSYKIATSTAEVTSADYIYLINNGANYDLYVLVDSTPTKVGDTSIDLSDYAKLTDLDSYYDKSASDGKFATITTVDNHINDIVAHLTQDERDKLVTTDELLKIAKDTYIEDADNPTSTICKSNGDTLNTPFKEGLTNASISLIISVARGSTSWNGQISISMASNNIYVRNKGADGWCRWSKFLLETDITTKINKSSTDTQIPSAKTVYNTIISGTKITSTDSYGSDIIYFPCGVYTIVSNVVATSLANLPSPVAGILTITSINPNVGLDSVYGYMNYRYETYMGDVYYRTLQSSVSTPVTIDYDTGWQKVCTTKVADSEGTATISNSATGTVSYKVVNGIAYVSVRNLADGLSGVQICTITGLPKAAVYVNTSIEKLGNNVGTIYTDDGITFVVHKVSTDDGYGSFSYPVAES